VKFNLWIAKVMKLKFVQIRTSVAVGNVVPT